MQRKLEPKNVLLIVSCLVLLASCLTYYLFIASPSTRNSPSVSVGTVQDTEQSATFDDITKQKGAHDGNIKKVKSVEVKPSISLPFKRPSNSLDNSFKPKGQQKPNQRLAFLENLKTRTLNSYIPINNGTLTIANINTFNNVHLAPLLEAITSMDYFRYVKLNLKKKCSLWTDNTKCALRDCTIRFCDEADLPASIISDEKAAKSEEDCPPASPIKLAKVEYVSSEHEETLDSLFECSLNDLENGQYIDLLQNPERYTGYNGDPAHRIWRSIYEENCFFKNGKPLNPFLLDNLCYEERIFYRAISGLHTSINIHLCAEYPLVDGTFTHNVKEFLRRFQDGEGYLTNLYFIFILELRALQKCEQYLLSKVTLQSVGDLGATKDVIRNLVKAVRSFKWHFNETNLFKREPQVAHEFAEKFRNITSNIMDCVGCDKCKLWGKVQIHGLGTAFKILISDNIETLHLSRHEIITLINAVAKLSNSIRQLDTFEKMITKTGRPNNTGFSFG